MGYRVKRPREYSELMEFFREKAGLPAYYDVMVFAAAVGFQEASRKSFTETSEPIDIGLFDHRFYMPFIYALGLSETKDPKILRDENFEDLMVIFEEYACGGLAFLEGTVNRTAPVDALMNLIGSGDGEPPVNIFDRLEHPE